MAIARDLEIVQKYMTPIIMIILIFVIITIYYGYKYYKKNCSSEAYKNLDGKFITETSFSVSTSYEINLLNNKIYNTNDIKQLYPINSINYIVPYDNRISNKWNIDTVGYLNLLPQNNVLVDAVGNPKVSEAKKLVGKFTFYSTTTTNNIIKYFVRKTINSINSPTILHNVDIDITSEINAIATKINPNCKILTNNITDGLSFYINDPDTNKKNRYINFTSFDNASSPKIVTLTSISKLG